MAGFQLGLGLDRNGCLYSLYLTQKRVELLTRLTSGGQGGGGLGFSPVLEHAGAPLENDQFALDSPLHPRLQHGNNSNAWYNSTPDRTQPASARAGKDIVRKV